MSFIYALVHCLFASGAFFKIFAVLAFTDQMSCIGAYLHSLFALLADHEHRTCIIQMQISIILVLEFFVESLTEITNIFRVSYILRRGNLNKLVLCLFELFPFMFYWYFLCLISFLVNLNWSLILISIILSSPLMKFFLNAFYDLRS